MYDVSSGSFSWSNNFREAGDDEDVPRSYCIAFSVLLFRAEEEEEGIGTYVTKGVSFCVGVREKHATQIRSTRPHGSNRT